MTRAELSEATADACRDANLPTDIRLAEMQAIAPAPEGWRWEGTDTLVVLISRQDPTLLRVFCSGRRGKITAVIEFYQAGSLAARSIVDLEALLALRRLAGHLWPWPGWPVVPGVRPAGWGPATTAELYAHEKAHPDGAWLTRERACGLMSWSAGTVKHLPGPYLAVDAEGRWVEVDTRGQG